jgi:preprotein translocase subunit SecA
MLGLSFLFNSQNWKLRAAQKVVAKVNELEAEVEKMSYDQIKARIQEFKAQLTELVDKIPASDRNSLRRPDHDGKGLPAHEIAIKNKLLEFMPEMFAFIRETYKREMGIRHYDVQIMAGAYLAEGWKLAEIKTGEGKTMIFNLPLFLYALVGRGAHRR